MPTSPSDEAAWRPRALEVRRTTSVPFRLRRLEPYTAIALAAHAVAVNLGNGHGVLPPVAGTVVVLLGLGIAGAAGWRSQTAAAVRGVAIVVLAFALLALQQKGSGYFLLWFFVVVAVYPLVLPQRSGRLVAVVVPLVYLALLPFGAVAADGPVPVALLRAVSLSLMAVFVHTAAQAYRLAAADRDTALAVLDTFVAAAPVGLALWDEDLRLRRANDAMREALVDGLGTPDAGRLGQEVGELDGAAPALAANVRRVLASDLPTRDVELALGDRFWTSSYYPVRLGPRLLGIGTVLVEVTEQRAAERALTHSATHDGLTGLPNRALFTDRVHVALAQAGRGDLAVAVLFCDLDRFKVVNDSLGHAAGDDLLRATAERLSAIVREGDTVARLGGDEFALLCTGVEDASAARAIGERVCAAMREPLRVRDRLITSTMSVGVTFHRGGERTVAGLLQDADVAMYGAKDAGRDQVGLFESSKRADATQRFDFHTALRQAVEERRIGVQYQPIVPLSDGAGGVGFEALARWNRPGHGDVPPGVFVPVAEELGIIHVLGEHVLRTACTQLVAWRAETGLPLHVAVNLSARQLAGPAIVGTVAAVLAEVGLPASALQLEITESVLMVDLEHSLRRLTELRELGVSVAVDDFGTGYSSLAYLRDLPVDALKIDRSFTTRLPGDEAMFAFVVDLARAIGAQTVVEGVETPDQLEAVRRIGCDRAQGYHLGRPLTADAARAWLNALHPAPAV